MDDTAIRGYMSSVPDSDRFLTVDELHANVHALAARYPDVARICRVGTSTLGEPIHLLSIGRGSRNAFFFGCPHPNEPIGAMTIHHLSRLLCSDGALRERLDYTWHFVPCADPDGTRLNERWFAGPFTPTNYARHFYRPAFSEQVEWTFPISYKRLYFDRTLPETEALMRVIDRVQPEFMFSLHNSGFGGVYYYISRPMEPLHQTLQKIPGWEGLPLDLGEPETPFMEELCPAIFQLASARRAYDYNELHGGDPTKGWAGASSGEYADRYETRTLVVEMPYFDDPRVNDTRQTCTTRRDALLGKLDRSERALEELRSHYVAVLPDLRGHSPFQRAFADLLEVMRTNFQAARHWARTSGETARAATVAEVFSNDELDRFYSLLSVGQFLRMFDGELAIGNGTPAIRRHADAVRSLFDDQAQDLERRLQYRTIPIRKLVAVQLGAAFATMAYLQGHAADT